MRAQSQAHARTGRTGTGHARTGPFRTEVCAHKIRLDRHMRAQELSRYKDARMTFSYMNTCAHESDLDKHMRARLSDS